MDKSETYAKMCERAEELQLKQPRWERLKQDLDSVLVLEGEVVLSSDSVWALRSSGHVWLPRQDQLQEMIRQAFDDCDLDQLHAQFNIFIDWFNGSKGDWRIREAKSYEQLWLAFVMREKYNKVWDDEKWIKTVA